MADQGVAGLTLGEVARRMGIRPPSLYVYFDGKNALYDALFERGWQELLTVLLAARERPPSPSTEQDFLMFSATFVRWAVEHPAYAPLMFWRPVPGFTPTEQAYRPAIEIERLGREFLAQMQRRGGLRADVDLDLAYRTWTSATSGVMTQQLSNAPGESFETGTFTSTLPDVVAMWLAHFGGHRDRMSD
jgi:AcrR family transcriptional regulator